MYVVDASVWVARFVERDRFHSASYQWILNTIPAGVPLAGPVLVLPEVAGAVSRMTGDPDEGRRAVRLLSSLPGVTLLPVTEDIAQRASDMASSLRVRGSDAIYMALAEETNMALISWDDDHLERGASVVNVHRPSELLSDQRGLA
jgi:predicted nucleic acid-binding protein